jgi:hypothetical protein
MKSNVTLNKVTKVSLLLASLMAISCSKSGGGSNSGISSSPATGSNSNVVSSTSPLTAAGLVPNFRLSLTDAPNGSYNAIKVNIDRVEVLLTDGKKTALVPLTQGSGVVDLLGLQNGVTSCMGDLQVPKGVRITEVHVKLAKGKHEAVRSDGRKCKLPVSCGSDDDTFNIVLDSPIEFDGDHHANLVVDFDAKQSMSGKDDRDGFCNFEPVLTVKSAGKWKPDKDDDDDFDKKGHGLNNCAVTHEQGKRFGKKHHDGDDDRGGDDSIKVCQSAPAPAPATDPTVSTQPTTDPTVVIVDPTAVPNFFGLQ